MEFSQTQQQLAVTAIALKRYHLHPGKLSADLKALLSDYLSTLPRDPMDGKPLRYCCIRWGKTEKTLEATQPRARG